MTTFNPFEIALLESSFRKVSRQADDAATLFYTRLFELSPALRGYADGDFALQKRELIKLLGVVVHRLDAFELVREHIQEIGRCHAEISTDDDHHLAVGAALFWMLEKILGREFTPDCYAVWIKIYGILSEEMKAAVGELALAC